MGSEYTPAQARAAMKYLDEKTELVQLRMRKGRKDFLRSLAAQEGVSMTEFMWKAALEKAERDGLQYDLPED